MQPILSQTYGLTTQGLTHDPSDAIHVTDVLKVIQRSLVLLGNANNLISETLREVALESVHPSLTNQAHTCKTLGVVTIPKSFLARMRRYIRVINILARCRTNFVRATTPSTFRR